MLGVCSSVCGRTASCTVRVRVTEGQWMGLWPGVRQFTGGLHCQRSSYGIRPLLGAIKSEMAACDKFYEWLCVRQLTCITRAH